MTVTVRTLFFIDPKGVIRAIIYYPLNVGRNIDEILRVAQALQTSDEHGVACPVNWQKGDKVIVPPPSRSSTSSSRLSNSSSASVGFMNSSAFHTSDSSAFVSDGPSLSPACAGSAGFAARTSAALDAR